MKRSIFGLVLIFSLGLTGPVMAGFFKNDSVEKLDNAKAITVIVPNSPDVTDNHYTKLSFNMKKLGTTRSGIININGSNVVKREFIQVKKKIKGGVEIERRIDDGTAGSGRIYYVRCNLENAQGSTVLTAQPYQVKNYQQGVISFDVPDFTEADLTAYIIHHPITFKMELDSGTNNEAVFGNLARLAHKDGENYNLPTGRIIKGNFAIPYNGEKVNFTVELFPSKTGTKVEIQGMVNGQFTSGGVVDFNIILKDIRTKIESIVNS